MGVFSVVIDELEDHLNTTLRQLDVLDSALVDLINTVEPTIRDSWTGAGAEAFAVEFWEMWDQITAVINFSQGYTSGIRRTIAYLRQLDEMLSNPISAIGSIFGF